MRQNQDFHFLGSEVRRNTSHLLDNVCKKREVFVALLAVIVSFSERDTVMVWREFERC